MWPVATQRALQSQPHIHQFINRRAGMVNIQGTTVRVRWLVRDILTLGLDELGNKPATFLLPDTSWAAQYISAKLAVELDTHVW